MKNLLLLLFLAASLLAEVKVVTTYPFLAKIASEVGKGHVSVEALANPAWDPHFIAPKPSHIAKLAKCDLLILNGAGLEAGWLPPLVGRSANAAIQPGRKGYLDLSQSIALRDIPQDVSRAHGDVHPEGNPHYHLDPHNILPLAEAIAEKLAHLDPKNEKSYRQNLEAFLEKWEANLKRWDEQMAPFKGTKVVEYHELFNYFLARYGIECVGEIEPLPGIPPTARHTSELIETVKTQKVGLILQDIYHSRKEADFIASKTGAKVALLPHDVGSTQEAKSLEGLFDAIIAGVTK